MFWLELILFSKKSIAAKCLFRISYFESAFKHKIEIAEYWTENEWQKTGWRILFLWHFGLSPETHVIRAECSFDAVDFRFVCCVFFGFSSSSPWCGFMHAYHDPLAISIYAMRSSWTCTKSIPNWSRLFFCALSLLLCLSLAPPFIMIYDKQSQKRHRFFSTRRRIISTCSNNKRRSPSLKALLLYFFPIYYCIRRRMVFSL